MKSEIRYMQKKKRQYFFHLKLDYIKFLSQYPRITF